MHNLPLALLEQRPIDVDARGIVRRPGQSLADIYAERHALYERCADITIDCSGISPAQVLARLLAALAPEAEERMPRL